MNTEKKSPLKLLLRGFVAPLLILLTIYYAVVAVYLESVFPYAARARFLIEFFDRDLAKTYPPIEFVVLGDSTAKASINPTDYAAPFGINLGVNGGTAMVAYHVLDRYLRTHPPPNCVLYISQYNWRRNYRDFFSKVIFHHYLDLASIAGVWKIGAEHGVFPATEYTMPGYYSKAVRNWLYIDDLPLDLIQKSLRPNRTTKKIWKRAQRYAVLSRGFQVNKAFEVLPEEKFFGETHQVLLQGFDEFRSEDFYLRMLVQRSRKENIHFMYALLPVADAPMAAETSRHISERNAHIVDVFGPDVTRIGLPRTLPRMNFKDFTHVNLEGVAAIRPAVEGYLTKYCSEMPSVE